MAARPRFTSRRQAFNAALAMSRIVDSHGLARIGAVCSVQAIAVSRWTFCPERHVPAVAAATGVPAHELRPDLFPAPVTDPRLDAEIAIAAHLAAGAYLARTGRALSTEGR